MSHESPFGSSPPAFSRLPRDELIQYGRSLGIHFSDDIAQSDAQEQIRRRLDLLAELDQQAMLEVVAWLRRPVRQSATKEQLAAIIASQYRTDYSGLSNRGLATLAKLKGVVPHESEPRESLERRLRKVDGASGRFRRFRRRVAGAIVARLFSASGDDAGEAYRFLPEENPARPLREEINESGLVGGVARKLRGVADEYIAEKLDEIERRIDLKLNEIDRRLGEWRDREVANRLRILKITLVVSIIVAIVSLVYDYLRPPS